MQHKFISYYETYSPGDLAVVARMENNFDPNKKPIFSSVDDACTAASQIKNGTWFVPQHVLNACPEDKMLKKRPGSALSAHELFTYKKDEFVIEGELYRIAIPPAGN